MQIVPSDFAMFHNFKHQIAQSISLQTQKGSFCGFQNTPKMRIRPRLCLEPC